MSRLHDMRLMATTRAPSQRSRAWQRGCLTIFARTLLNGRDELLSQAAKDLYAVLALEQQRLCGEKLLNFHRRLIG